MKNMIVPLVLVIAVIGGVLFLNFNSAEDSTIIEPVPSAFQVVTEEEPTTAAAIPVEETNADSTESSKISPTAKKPGRYIDYTATSVTEAAENKGKAVLFFHAAWCPTCKAAEEDILANADKIPSDLTIIKTDYDTEIELRKKYGITIQHTFVQVDSEGNQISKWVGGNFSEIVENIE